MINTLWIVVENTHEPLADRAAFDTNHLPICNDFCVLGLDKGHSISEEEQYNNEQHQYFSKCWKKIIPQ